MTPYQPKDEVTINAPQDPNGTFLDVTIISHEPLTNTYLVSYNNQTFHIHASDIIEYE